jgi:hypothetical protein
MARLWYNMGVMRLRKDQVRLKALTDEDDDYMGASPAERLSFMWELTAEIWSLQGRDRAEQRLQRHAANLTREGG